MKEEPQSPETPEIDPAETPESREDADRRKISRIADEMAGKAIKTVKKYDREHESISPTGPGGIS